MAENFPHLKKESDIQIQEAHKVPNKMNSKRSTLRHTIIKMAGVKDTGSKRKTRTCLQVDFSAEICRPEGSGMMY